MRKLSSAIALVVFASNAFACGNTPDAKPPLTAPSATPSASATASASATPDAAAPTAADTPDAAAPDCATACDVGRRCMRGRCEPTQPLAAGSQASCAVRGGRVLCWGEQPSLDATKSSPHTATPTPIAGISDAVQISTAGYAGCAVHATGALTCWGETRPDQGSNPNRQIAPHAIAATDALHVAVGNGRVCFATRTGEVYCLGYNSIGQLGDGTTRSRTEPTRVLGVDDAIAVAVGESHSCALRKSGTIRCWRGGAWGNAKPVDVEGVTSAVALAVGRKHACVVTRDGGVACWGDNYHAQVGAPRGGNVATPRAVPGVDDAVEVAAGEEHTCAARRSGKVTCWGQGDKGQTGGGKSSHDAAPADVAGVDDAIHVAAGWGHTCAMRRNGSVACWGANYKEELGVVTNTEFAQPRSVGIADATQIAMGPTHACALRASGAVTCWGESTHGELGPVASFVAPTDVQGVSDAIAIGVTERLTCALKRSGGGVCFGATTLATTATKPIAFRAPLAAPSGASSLVMSLGRACTLGAGGDVACWGTPSGDVAPTTITPRPATFANDVVALTLSPHETLAVRKGGAVVWPEATTNTYRKPQAAVLDGLIKGLSGVTAVATDGGRGCVARAGGDVQCWEFPLRQQPWAPPPGPRMGGNDTPTFNPNPPPPPPPPPPPTPKIVPLAGFSGIVELTIDAEICGLRRDGAVVCTYTPREGDDDEKKKRPPFATVPGLRDAVHIANASGGWGTVCAVRKTGDVVCWGPNRAGIAGVEPVFWRGSPIEVALP